MPNTTRARVKRAQNTSGTDAERELREVAREVLPSIGDWIRANPNDPKARELVLEIVKDDLDRSRAGDQDELLLRLKAVRESGSPQLEAYWNKVYGRLYPVG